MNGFFAGMVEMQGVKGFERHAKTRRENAVRRAKSETLSCRK
jgi:hypothetical protein